MVEYGREWQIAVDCRRLRQSWSRSLVTKLVEIGRRMQGIIGVSYNSTTSLNLNFCEVGL